MSTTVNYKGNTIATLDNETKTLTTKGTWLEDDIEITDESSGGSQSLIVDTPDVNGGTIREITTDTVVMLEGAKTVTPSSTQQIITPSQGYSGFSSVMVEGGRYTVDDFCELANISGDVICNGTWIRPYAFFGNTAITSFTANNVTSCSHGNASTSVNTFNRCTNLESVSFPKILNWDRTDYIFADCTKLKTINFDFMNITKLATGWLQNCPAITKTIYVFPKLISNIWSYTLTNNTNVTTFDIESSDTSTTNLDIHNSAFTNDSNLDTIIIRSAVRIRTLANIKAFNGTPFASDGTGGTLYVPQSMISSYESATNWSTLLAYTNNQIKSIESTHTDPNATVDLTLYYADGTPIPSD